MLQIYYFRKLFSEKNTLLLKLVHTRHMIIVYAHMGRIYCPCVTIMLFTCSIAKRIIYVCRATRM